MPIFISIFIIVFIILFITVVFSVGFVIFRESITEKLIMLLKLHGYNAMADELENAVMTVANLSSPSKSIVSVIFEPVWLNFRKLKIDKEHRALWKLQLSLKIFYIGEIFVAIGFLGLVLFILISMGYFEWGYHRN